MQISHLTEDLPKIKTPSLLVWGKNDFVVAPSLGEEMLEKLGTAETDKSLIIFDDSGHSPFDSEADRFVNELRNISSLWIHLIHKIRLLIVIGRRISFCGIRICKI